MTSKPETTPPQHIPCFDCEGYGRCVGACEQQTTAAAKIASGLQDAIEGRVTVLQPISPVALVRRKLADGRTISDPDVRGLLAEIDRLRAALAAGMTDHAK